MVQYSTVQYITVQYSTEYTEYSAVKHLLGRVVHKQQRRMSHKPRRERHATRVRGRVTRPYELYTP